MTNKKRSHLVIGEGALLIADYFDWVDYLRLVADVGHQSNVTSTLDSHGQCALMESAGAGDTAGNDLCTLRDVLTQTGREPSVLSKAIAYYLLLDFYG